MQREDNCAQCEGYTTRCAQCGDESFCPQCNECVGCGYKKDLQIEIDANQKETGFVIESDDGAIVPLFDKALKTKKQVEHASSISTRTTAKLTVEINMASLQFFDVQLVKKIDKKPIKRYIVMAESSEAAIAYVRDRTQDMKAKWIGAVPLDEALEDKRLIPIAKSKKGWI